MVPAPGEWTTPPYEPTIREGKLYARGTIDDKGPVMAAFYALKKFEMPWPSFKKEDPHDLWHR